MPTVLFEATYFILDNDYVTSYLLQLIADMKDVLTRLDSGHDHIRIEIYKHQRFKYWFHLYINEVVTAPMRCLFLICHFPFAEFLVSLFRPIQRELYQFYRIQMRYPEVSTRVVPRHSHCIFHERVR